MFDGRDKWVQHCAERINAIFRFSAISSSELSAENKASLDLDAFVIAGSPDLAPKLFGSKDLKRSIRDRVIEHKLAIQCNNDCVRGFNEAVSRSKGAFEAFKRARDRKAVHEFRSYHEERPNSVCIGFEETLRCIEMQIVKKVLYSNQQQFAFCRFGKGSGGRVHREFVRFLADQKGDEEEEVEETKAFLRRMCAENDIEFVVVDLEDPLLSQCVGMLHEGIDLSLYAHAQDEEVTDIPETIWTEKDQRRLERALECQRQLDRADRSWKRVAELVPGKSAQECRERFRQIRTALKRDAD